MKVPVDIGRGFWLNRYIGTIKYRMYNEERKLKWVVFLE